MELSDLEICKKIAEIEGCLCFVTPSGYVSMDPWGNEYNPLTDGALNNELIEKHHILIDWIGLNQKVLKPKCQAYWEANSLDCVSDESLKKAVCLAVIAKFATK